MKRNFTPFLFSGLLLAGFVRAESISNTVQKETLQNMVRSQSAAALLEESTAVKQAETRARSNSSFGFELRPQLSESDTDWALRIYLPDRWSKKLMREQLDLASESERLAMTALEWAELMGVYRNFCTYRLLRKQLVLFDQELQFIAPTMKKANLAVQQHELTPEDRAKLYGDYLALLTDREKTEAALLGIEQSLHFTLGNQADLESLSNVAIIEIPSQMNDNDLLRMALRNRADYRQLDINAQSFSAASAVARSEDWLGLKYIQPSYNVSRDGGESTWAVSAAFALWGTRDPNIAVYEQQRMLTLSARAQQRALIENRLSVLLETARTFSARMEQRNEKLTPLLEQMGKDLEAMNAGPLETFRDLIAVRGRILDASMQTATLLSKKELIAVDLAEELGVMAPDLNYYYEKITTPD